MVATKRFLDLDALAPEPIVVRIGGLDVRLGEPRVEDVLGLLRDFADVDPRKPDPAVLESMLELVWGLVTEKSPKVEALFRGLDGVRFMKLIEFVMAELSVKFEAQKKTILRGINKKKPRRR